MREEKTVEKLLIAMAHPMYSPANMGNVVKNLPPVQQVELMRSIYAILDSLAHDYIVGYYDVRNERTARAAYLAIEAIKAEGLEL